MTEGDATLNHTPNTENSTNTKVRPRNVTEAVIFDTKEETPPKPNKIIKVEKVIFFLHVIYFFSAIAWHVFFKTFADF